MVIYGVALLAFSFIGGQLMGELLGEALNIDANVGGVGFGMMILIFLKQWLSVKGFFRESVSEGIAFWNNMYVPIIVAMTATQNVKAAVSSGLLAVLVGIIPVAIGFALIPYLARFIKGKSHDGTGS
ncbi:MAG TPA: malonate transporter subunit MadL [Cyclobacteriaceae bacterium]|nr:malonate transporter subunit MadL [Cyclobacteriaceae bacterium]